MQFLNKADYIDLTLVKSNMFESLDLVFLKITCGTCFFKILLLDSTFPSPMLRADDGWGVKIFLCEASCLLNLLMLCTGFIHVSNGVCLIEWILTQFFFSGTIMYFLLMILCLIANLELLFNFSVKRFCKVSNGTISFSGAFWGTFPFSGLFYIMRYFWPNNSQFSRNFVPFFWEKSATNMHPVIDQLLFIFFQSPVICHLSVFFAPFVCPNFQRNMELVSRLSRI